MRKKIGADWLVYQELDDLIECAREGNPEVKQFDCSVFDGQYITGDVDQAYLDNLRERRSDASKNKIEHNLPAVNLESAVVDLYNDAS